MAHIGRQSVRNGKIWYDTTVRSAAGRRLDHPTINASTPSADDYLASFIKAFNLDIQILGLLLSGGWHS
jgi:hypothetical protein